MFFSVSANSGYTNFLLMSSRLSKLQSADSASWSAEMFNDINSNFSYTVYVTEKV